MMYSVPEDCFFFANSAEPDEMSPYVAIQLNLHCLPKYLFTHMQNKKIKHAVLKVKLSHIKMISND